MNGCDENFPNTETEMKMFLVIGIGNSVLSDDAVGLHVIERARKLLGNLKPFVDFEENCAAGLDLLYDMEGYEKVLLVDCMKTGRYRPGTYITFEMGDLEHLRQNRITDSHALNLLTVIDAGKICGYKMPRNIIILGIEGADITTFSENLTEEVEECVDAVVHRIEKTILSWIMNECCEEISP